MALPIRLGLVLEGEDAIAFDEYMKNPPKPTKEQLEFFSRAIEIYKSNKNSMSD